jgi:hypothetical protein
MSIQESDETKYIGNTRIEYVVKYREDIREEECHGIHLFYDQEEISKKITGIFLEFDGYEIDLTSRIKKDELDEILYYLE